MVRDFGCALLVALLCFFNLASPEIETERDKAGNTRRDLGQQRLHAHTGLPPGETA